MENTSPVDCGAERQEQAAVTPARGRSLLVAGGLAVALALVAATQAMQHPSRAQVSGLHGGAASSVPLEAGGKKGAELLPTHTGATLLRSGLSSADPFIYRGAAVDRERAAECLALAAWYEVGDDPAGQRAVIQTVVNRVASANFPNSICGVVFQGSHLPTGCQFTFTCDGSMSRRQPSPRAWERALVLSEKALDGFVDETVGKATNYHADYVTPWWSDKLERLTSVGPHIFYRWAEGRGSYRVQRHLSAEQDYRALIRSNRSPGPEAALAIDRPVSPVTPKPGTGSPAIASAPALLAPASPGSAIFLEVNAGEASGRWALAAIAACRGRSDCQVLGYGSPDQIAQNQGRAGEARERPMFLLVKDSASNMVVALWDCDRIARPTLGECLPHDQKALARLMRERPSRN